MALHGRRQALDRVGDLLAAAREGRSGSLVICGEAGCGKSTLMAEAAASADGFEILRSTGLEAERELPYGLLHQLIGPALDRIGDLPDPQAHALRAIFGIERDVSPDRFLASVAVLSLLARLGEEAPLLCVVDDVQWADAASADALVFVARRLEFDGIALLLASRDGSGSQFDGTELPTLELGPLDPANARALLEEGSGDFVAASVADRLVEETGGNALALSELATMLSADQLGGAAPLPVPLPLGGGLERTYSKRIGSLPEETREATLLVALLGDAPTRTVLDAMSLLGIADGALDPAEREGFLIVDADRVRFRHPLLRSAVHAAASLQSRRTAHRALAEMLRGDPDRRAWQLASAAVGPDPAVTDQLVAAADRARDRGAPAIASAALERAADLTAPERRRVALLTRAAEDAWRGGAGERAMALIERARSLEPSEELTRSLGRLQGTVDAWCGRPAMGCVALCREADDVATDNPSLALELLAEAAEAASFTGEVALSDEVGQVAERVADTGADAYSQLRRRLLLGTHRFATGDIEVAVPMLREAIRIGRDLDEPVALNLAGRAAIYLGDEAESIRLDRRAEAIAREQGAVFTLPSILVRRAISEIWLARPLVAETTAAEALRLARETGQEDLVACAKGAKAYAAALRGDEDSCRREAEGALRISDQRGLNIFADLSRAAVGQLELGAGRAAEALAMLAPISHPGVVLRTMLDRVEAAARSDRRDLAGEWAEQAERWAELSGIAAARAVALHCRAVVADDGSAQLLASALELHSRIDRPLEKARSELELGRVMRRDRSRAEARVHLETAVAGFERIGARLWAEQARGELRASGRSARRRDPTTLDELTPQEIQVGRLVAQGMTNREVAAQLFLSPRTIDFHLRNLFRKLGIKSRTQLAHVELG